MTTARLCAPSFRTQAGIIDFSRKQDLDNVADLRIDRQGPSGGPQCVPREKQDQADLSAQSAECDADVGQPRPFGAAARFEQRDALRGWPSGVRGKRGEVWV